MSFYLIFVSIWVHTYENFGIQCPKKTTTLSLHEIMKNNTEKLNIIPPINSRKDVLPLSYIIILMRKYVTFFIKL